MAMAFAPLGLLFPIKINDPEVISKSYTGFWKDLISLGFEIK
jgi:3-phosphoshikimate 1-carboxyvinyltransferase